MTDTMVTPGDTLARSGLYRKIADAEFLSTPESAIAASYSADDSEQARNCGLCDLTPVIRTGWRGKTVAEHLQSLGYPVPENPNQALTKDSGETLVRLSRTEFWVLGSLQDMGTAVTEAARQPSLGSDCYPLFCQDSHAWLMLSGDHCAGVMAKLCGVDMRAQSFPPGSVAQTSVARINAIVVHHQVAGTDVFSLLFDAGYHAYLWDVLQDAMAEFSGAPVGVRAFGI